MPPLRSDGFSPKAEHPEYAGQYRLGARLGTGGMGVVHLATSVSGMRLAIKVVHAEHARDPEFRARFRQEVSAARKVSGAFTAPVVDADPDAERPWMATRFIPGPTLAEQVKQNGPMDAVQVRRLGAGLAEALRDIHRAGVVHRDLKPSNVLLAADGPKVIDFGISRPADSDLRTETGKLIGTPPFMAPEQFQRPREVGPAADVFAMGAVMVHAATGSGPFDSDSPYLVAYQVVHDEPELTGVPEDLEPLIRRCLAKDPAERPSPDDLMVSLRSAAYGTEAFIRTQQFPSPLKNPTDASASPAPTETTLPKRSGRHRWAVAAAVALTLAASGLAFLAVPSNNNIQDAKPRPPVAAQVAFHPWSVPLTSMEKSPTPYCSSAYNALYCTVGEIKAVRLNLDSGEAAWSERSTATDRDMPPVPAGGLLLIPPQPGSDQIEALDPSSGGLRWSAKADAFSTLHPAGDSVLVARPDGVVTSLDSTTGTRRWARQLGSSGTELLSADDGPFYLTTVAKDSATTSVKAISPDNGNVLWTRRVPGILTPVGTADGALFLLSLDSVTDADAVVRLDIATRSIRRIRLDAPISQAQGAVDGDTVYVFGAGGSLLAVDTEAGTQPWRLETSAARASQPVVANGHVYLTAADGRLLAVDAAKGRLLGQTKPRMADGKYTFIPALPAPVAVGGKVFASAPDGSVFAVDAADPARW
ncbi:serine/threonine-protein kinase [Streptomyces sannanensis]|uniref:Serine/threonine-protein kinase n=1 Tax=Streptomyces sannanensis TaxID=285536 RepID=A0ABP6SDW2_9ACTN